MPSSTRLLQRDRSLLAIALDCHMAHTGASDPALTYALDINLLRQAQVNWDYNANAFDNAVLMVINAVLLEANQAKTPAYPNYLLYTVTGETSSAAIIVAPDGVTSEIVLPGTDALAIASAALHATPSYAVVHLFTDDLALAHKNDHLNHSFSEPLASALARHHITYWYANQDAGTLPEIQRAQELATANQRETTTTPTPKTQDNLGDTVIVYCDGACPDNGKPTARSGVGIVICDARDQIAAELSAPGIAPHTNQRAEIYAVIRALEDIPSDVRVTLFSDSQYVVNTITKGWRRNANHDLWERLDRQVRRFGTKPEFHWIKGHNGHPRQERADRLAVEAAAQVRLAA